MVTGVKYKRLALTQKIQILEPIKRMRQTERNIPRNYNAGVTSSWITKTNVNTACDHESK